MSCYICDNKTISVIARAFRDYEADFRDNDGVGLINPTAIGQALLNQNYASVNYRYEEETVPPKFKLDYTAQYDEGDAVGCIQCYSYQANETEDWDESNIRYSLDNLMRVITERLVKKCGMRIPWGYGNYFD